MEKKCQQKAISIYPFWVICDLMVNYIQIQDFVELPCISLLWHTWNNTENILENYEIILEKVLEKCLNFFLDICLREVFFLPCGVAWSFFFCWYVRHVDLLAYFKFGIFGSAWCFNSHALSFILWWSHVDHVDGDSVSLFWPLSCWIMFWFSIIYALKWHR